MVSLFADRRTLLRTMRLSTGISSSEEKSTTHVSSIERRCTSLTLALAPDCGRVTLVLFRRRALGKQSGAAQKVGGARSKKH